MIQQILVILVFVAAVGYLVSLVVKQFRAKSGCATGCGKCGALDIKAIEARINEARKE
ncbi:MAG: FeoB-associated Cys-rich membrane protein [Bacteroidota bacterium]|jgi:bacterioferritin-associated ferredoxin|nr:MAG: FeoB-associated Cys-rich membrane protein [Bacteroidota bacterium]